MAQVEQFSSLSESVQRSVQIVVDFLPTVLAALGLLLVGWVLARLLRALSARIISRLYRLLPSRAFQRELKTSGMEQLASNVVAGLVFWVVFLFFFAAATETLGLPVISTLLSGLARYLPNVLAAVLIVVSGVVLGNLARGAIITAAASARLVYGELLGRTAQVILWLIAGVIAVDQIGIDSTFLMVSLGIVLWAVISGAALAFGLGARTAVSNLLASHYVLQTYKAGQHLRIGALEGKILEITPTGVILETAGGRAFVPAKRFSETTSVLLRNAG